MLRSCGKKKSEKLPQTLGAGKEEEEKEVLQTTELRFPCKPCRDHSEACHVEGTMTEKICMLQHIMEQMDIP